MSRLFGILAMITTGSSLAGTFLGSFNPKWAAIVLGVSAGVSAFTERVQGGKSKLP